MSRSRLSMTALVAALLVVLTACGGSDALTAKQWRVEADKVCKSGQGKVATIGKDLPAKPTTADVTEVVSGLADVLQDEADQIAELKAPSILEDDVTAMISSLRDGIRQFRAAGASALDAKTSPFQDATIKAQDLGLKVCGNF